MDALAIFCRQIRARSAEHREAMTLVHGRNLAGQVVSILRQELDSMVRAIFLLAQPDRTYRHQLIQASVDGEKWKANGSNRCITDREMVDLAQIFRDWTQSVYKFGCAFIRLSSLHDYRERDPIHAISEDERQSILGYLRYYHGGPSDDHPSFADLMPYLPNVFQKIADNLECYLTQLENDEDLDI
jgi:hypothetical protein